MSWQVAPLAGQEITTQPQPIYPPPPEYSPQQCYTGQRILQILSQRNLFFERIVERPSCFAVFHGSVEPGCCLCLALCPYLGWLMYCIYLTHCDKEIDEFPQTPRKFTLEGDVLKMEMSYSEHPIRTSRKFSVKFSTTVQRPCDQTMTISLKHDVIQNFKLQIRATILELSDNRIVFNVDIFDGRQHILFFKSEYTLCESRQEITIKEKTSNIVEVLYRQKAACNVTQYYVYETITEYGYDDWS